MSAPVTDKTDKADETGQAARREAELLQLLQSLNIQYEYCAHPAVFTVDQAREAVPLRSGLSAKNLFVQSKKGERLFLVVVPYEKSVDLRALGDSLGVGKLTLASPETLFNTLGLKPGAVSVFGLMHDTYRRASLVIDQPLWDAPRLQAHPLVNTATIAFDHAGLERFLKHTGHQPIVMNLPSRQG
jgi:Ala-tRNA(Pro) deacylase